LKLKHCSDKMFNFLILLLLSSTIASGSKQGDPSGLVSVAFRKGQWKVFHELIDWTADETVIARANFTNAQESTGWMLLEVQTRESAPDQLQAQAAGLAEGYLTRTNIIENYKEFFANDICSSDPDACTWLKETFALNQAFVDGMIAQKAQTDPYWHQVNLYYLQMTGITQGYQLRSLTDKVKGNTNYFKEFFFFVCMDGRL
jgi:hypothetical protein